VTGGDRCIDLWHATMAQLFETVGTRSALAAKDRIAISGGFTS
jgi:hypothetical protein